MARDFDHIWLGMGMDQYQTTIHIPLSTFWPFCSIFALFFFVFGIITDFNLCPVGALNVGSQTCKGCKLVGGWWKSQRRPGGNHAASFFFSFSAQRNAKKAIMDLLNHTEPAICWWFIHVYTTHLVLWRRVYYYSTNMISQQFVGWDELHGVMGKPHGGSWTSSQSAEAATGILFHGLHTPDDLARLHLDFSLVHCLFLFADGCGDRLSFLIQRSSWQWISPFLCPKWGNMSPLDGPTWPIGWPIMLLLHSQRQPFSSCFCLGKLVWGAHLNLFSFEQIVDRSFLCKCI